MLIADVLADKGRKVAKVVPTDTVETAVRKLAELRIGAVVVEDRWGKLVGIFSERDLVNWLAQHGSLTLDREVREVMTADVLTCPPSDRIDAVLQRMTTHRIRHMPVMENGALIGIVSIGDLVKHRLDEKAQEADVLLDIARMRH